VVKPCARSRAPSNRRAHAAPGCGLCRAFARECQPGSLAVELGAPIDELLNRRGAFLHQRVHRRAVAEAISRAQRVALMQFDLVIVAQSDGTPPCAYSEEDSRRLSFATTSTWPASASSMAARKPGHSGSNDEESPDSSATAMIAVGPLVAPAILCVPLTGSPAPTPWLSSFALRARR